MFQGDWNGERKRLTNTGRNLELRGGSRGPKLARFLIAAIILETPTGGFRESDQGGHFHPVPGTPDLEGGGEAPEASSGPLKSSFQPPRRPLNFFSLSRFLMSALF
jgi:hypothetical protein